MKKVVLLAVALVVGVVAYGQNKMSPVMRGAISEASASEALHAWVTMDNASMDALSASGVKVESRFNGMALVSGDARSIKRVAQLQGVKGVSAPSHLKLLCDSSRSVTHVNPILAGTNLPCAYDGSGVVLGMIDCGIDYNHMAFKDAQGNTRISRVYHPVEKGDGVLVDGDLLPGKDYTTPTQIAALTTDDKFMSHGCHTTGIAAGTMVGAYGGMAPGTEIAYVGIPNDNLEDYNVVLGMRYIAAYAASVGKPCVINMSLGNHDGPHDGTGFMARAMEELNKKYGTIFVVSAGNEGATSLYLNKAFTAADKQLSSVMMTSNGNRSEIDIWSRDSKPLTIEYNIYNYATNTVLCSSGPVRSDSTLYLARDAQWAQYSSGNIKIQQGVDPVNGRYHIYVDHSANISVMNCYLSFTVRGEDGTVVDAWDVNGDANFSSCGLAGFSDGNDIFSISDMATGDYSISVGACAGRTSYPVVGRTYTNGYTMGGMARFSSYGTDLRGQVHPFIVAPGVNVVSSVSSFNCSKTSYSQRTYDNDNNAHYWYTKNGTSMSAPCVAGIVALWLQACPSLTIEQIKDVMAETAMSMPYTTVVSGPHGEIDAYAGIQLILQRYSKPQGDVNGDGSVDVTDLNILVNIMLGNDNADRYDGRAFVAGGTTVDITDVNTLLNILLTK
ncbi:MAG: S8 family serine peptidase [Muribaculaceae bacterium]|nr:S8 family serine peptidase [Muribaculaceae bacterium]